MKPAGLFILTAALMAPALFFGCQPRLTPVVLPAYAEQPTPTPPVKDESAAVTVAAVGDIMLGSPVPDDTRMPPNDGEGMLAAVTPILSAADIAFGNLEGPLADSGFSAKCRPPKPAKTPEPAESPQAPEPAKSPELAKPGKIPPPPRCFAFRMPTRYAKHLKDAGFDVVSLANNHAGDFGDAGRATSRKALDALGIKHAGSDRFSFSTAYLEVNGLKIAIIGFAHNKIVPNVNDLITARRLVTEADKTADIVIVSFHGGAEGTGAQNVPKRTEIFLGEKRGNLPLFSRTVIDAGADLVLGHGPHVLRGMEIYRDRLIAYSLGNFATYGWFRLEAETALTVILEARLDAEGRFLGGRINAARLEGRGIPMLDDSGEAVRKIRSLSLADFPLTAPIIADDGTISLKKEK